MYVIPFLCLLYFLNIRTVLGASKSIHFQFDINQFGITLKEIVLAIRICNFKNIIQNNNVVKHKTVGCDEKRERTL